MHTRQRGEGFVGRIEAETVISGILAGAIMGGLEMVASLAGGYHLLLPLRYAASVVMSRHAFEAGWLTVVLIGGVVHFSIATMFAFAFGVFNTQVPWRSRIWGAREALLGMVFATLIWLLDFQLIARFFYPGMLDHSQVMQWWLHVVGFGFPLGLLFAAREKTPAQVVRPAGGPTVRG
jgi:hypothetical protein